MRSVRTTAGACLVLLAGLTAATAGEAGAQEGAADAAASEAAAEVRERFEADAARRIVEAADAAARAGAPRELVYEKALEGLAKGVPTPRIVAAVEGFAERVARGAGLLGDRAGRADVSTAAEALGRGVPAREVRAMAREVEPASLSVALLVLADLVDLGAPAAEARQLLTEAVDAGMGGSELLELEARVRGMVRRGTSPPAAVAEARQSVQRGEMPGTSGR